MRQLLVAGFGAVDAPAGGLGCQHEAKAGAAAGFVAFCGVGEYVDVGEEVVEDASGGGHHAVGVLGGHLGAKGEGLFGT